MALEPENHPLYKDLKSLREELDSFFLNQHQRIVPFSEALADRWEKARRLGFAEGASIHDLSYVIGDVSVGKDTYIGPYTFLDGTGGLSIGENCSISAGVQIYTHDSVRWALSGGKLPYDKSPVSIGDHCYVAPYVVVSRGVSIGNNSIVGAHSMVKNSFPNNSIIMGTPAKHKGTVVIKEDGEITLQYDK